MLDKILIIVSVTSLVMLTPGPDMVLVIRNTLVYGRRAGLQTSIGVLSGNLVHITYGVLGIGLLISQSIVAFSTLKFAAAAYLIYLGIMAFRTDADTAKADDVVGLRRPNKTWFVQGFVNNLLNPKGTLFYLGVFTTVITPEMSASAILLLTSIMMLISASFWLFFVHVLDRATIRGFIERSQRTVSRIFGAVLLLLGVRLAFSTR